MSGLVLDASTALAWLLNEEPAVAPELKRQVVAGPIHAPALFVSELGNGLLKAEWRKRIASGSSAAVLALAVGWAFQFHPSPTMAQLPGLIALGRTHNLTIYDATYLDLAMRHNLPIATFDKAIARAAAVVGVPLMIAP